MNEYAVSLSSLFRATQDKYQERFFNALKMYSHGTVEAIQSLEYLGVSIPKDLLDKFDSMNMELESLS